MNLYISYYFLISDILLNEVVKTKQTNKMTPSEDSLECAICHQNFAQKLSLETHFSLHLQNFINENKSNMKHNDHKETEQSINISSEKLYPCEICEKTFASYDSLKVHGRFHSGEKPYSCSYCDKKFTTSGNLNGHKRIHTGEKPHFCKVCGRTFSELSNMKRHALLHTDQKSYSCLNCGKTFTQMCNLERHQMIHEMLNVKANMKHNDLIETKQNMNVSLKKSFPCKICGKNLASRDTLQIHGRFHSGEKPYPCHYCDKKFITSGKVKGHERTHTGEKPHCCKVCGKNFSELSNLRRHELLHKNVPRK